MLLQTVRPNIVQSIRAYRVEDLMQAAEGVGQHFLYANLANAQSKQDVLEAIAEAFLFPAHFGKNLDALYDCMTDLVHKPGTSRASWSCWSSCPTTRASTARRASSCSTCSAMPPTSGRSEKYHSGASILFSSPLPGKRVMGAGDGSGPQRRSQASGEERPSKTRGERELRHEHAADEQRVRHGDVAQRGVIDALTAFAVAQKAARRAAFLCALQRRRRRRAHACQRDVLVHRHFLGAPLHVESAGEAALRPASGPSVWRSSLRRCENATPTSSPSSAGIERRRASATAACARPPSRTRGGGSKASGGTSSTDSMS